MLLFFSQTKLPLPAIKRRTENCRKAQTTVDPVAPKTAAVRPAISRQADKSAKREREKFPRDAVPPTVSSPKTTRVRGGAVAEKRGRVDFPSLTETTTRRHAQNAVDSVTPSIVSTRKIVKRERERFLRDTAPPSVSSSNITRVRDGTVVEKSGRDVTSLWTRADFPSLTETTTRRHAQNAVHSVAPSKDSSRQIVPSRADKSAKRKRERFSGDRVPPTASSSTTPNSLIITGGRGHATVEKRGHEVMPPQTTPDFRSLTATTTQPPLEDDDAW